MIPAKRFGLIGGLLLMVLLLAAWLYLHAPRLRPIGGLDVYRTAQPDGQQLEAWMNERGLRSLINLRGENPGQDWYQEQQRHLGELEVREFSLGATRLPNRSQLLGLYQALVELPRPLLIHCQHGNDRSGLAAIMLRLMQPASSLEQAEQELPFFTRGLNGETVGLQFLQQYRGWLENGRLEHSPNTLARFVEQGYLDPMGNLGYRLEDINGQSVPAGLALHRLTVAVGQELKVHGWAFDGVIGEPLAAIHLQLDDGPGLPARIGIGRGDVARVMGDERWAESGWQVRASAPTESGCHNLHLQLQRQDGSLHRSQPLARLCTE